MPRSGCSRILLNIQCYRTSADTRGNPSGAIGIHICLQRSANAGKCNIFRFACRRYTDRRRACNKLWRRGSRRLLGRRRSVGRLRRRSRRGGAGLCNYDSNRLTALRVGNIHVSHSGCPRIPLHDQRNRGTVYTCNNPARAVGIHIYLKCSTNAGKCDILRTARCQKTDVRFAGNKFWRRGIRRSRGYRRVRRSWCRCSRFRGRRSRLRCGRSRLRGGCRGATLLNIYIPS